MDQTVLALQSLIDHSKKSPAVWRPTIFDLNKIEDANELQKLLDVGEIKTAVDDYEEQLKELFQIENPPLTHQLSFSEKFNNYLSSLDALTPRHRQGRWAYFPWLGGVFHILENEQFQRVRTSRNRQLITDNEQKKIDQSTVGLVGLGVGNSVALAFALQGGAGRIKLADHGRLALSDLNMVRGGVQFLKLSRTVMAARQIYELNPYAKMEIFPEGLTEANSRQFFDGLTVVVDETDNLALKYLIRLEARARRLPVIMGTNIGDNVLVDIERYDLDSDTPFFHGRLGEADYENLATLDKLSAGKLLTKYIGQENETDRMRQSFEEIGKTIVSRPQLGGAALLTGAAVAYVLRKIIAGEPVTFNRAVISFDEKMGS